MAAPRPLTEEDGARYQWQLGVAGFDESAQQRLKNTAVLITRVGGVGGALALQLAAAGVGKLVLAHAGNLRLNDLNRQVLMSEAGLGSARVDQAAQRLREFNSGVEIIAIKENVNAANVEKLVRQVDLVAGCAPLFEERLLLNRSAVEQRKPLVDCAMFELELQLTTVIPGRSPCLACLFPEPPPVWKREFPVFGAVAGTVAALGAMEVIKVAAGLGDPLSGHMLLGDLRDMTFRRIRTQRRDDCAVCAGD